MGRVVLFILAFLGMGLASCSSVDTSWMVDKPSPLVYRGYYSPAGTSSPVVSSSKSPVNSAFRGKPGYYNPTGLTAPHVASPTVRSAPTVSSPWASSKDPYRRTPRPASAGFAPKAASASFAPKAAKPAATGKKPYE